MALSELRPLCAPKRTSADHSKFIGSPLVDIQRPVAHLAQHWFCLTGKSLIFCPAPPRKIFPFASDPNHFYIPHRLVPQRGGSRVVTNAGRDAVDARVQGVQWQSQGEMNLVSDLAARETIGALADGKAVWSWHPLLVSSSRRQAGPAGSAK